MSGTAAVLSGVFAGRYTIEGELGRGATAIVYLARDQRRGHAVAIKVLRPELAESLTADRFLREIRLAERLHHPHILNVLDSGQWEGQLYVVLPHMEGGTLRMRLQREKQLPLDAAVAIARSVAEALAHAHEVGFVHRDVKPENILFTAGLACLGDFGIARALQQSMGDTTTSVGVVRGTPPYMSPEQASGEDLLDGRSDIYSLGCVVYEMIAGVQPFVGPTPQSVIAQRLIHRPRPVRVYRPTAPRAVEAVIERALAVSPADRYQTAAELADALELAVRTADDDSSAEDHGRRRRVGIAVLSTAAVLVAATVGIRAWPRSESVNQGIPEGDPRRVAVLYLDDLTPSTVPAHVADGLTEDLIDRLGSVRALHVISPNGVRAFRGNAIAIDSVRRALKVGTIVSGSVARSGNTMRINVRLVDAATGQQLYSKSLERAWTELFALQDTLADHVAFFLRQRLGDAIALRRSRAATKSYPAWEAVQLASDVTRRAIEAGNLQGDRRAPLLFLSADSLYERAARLDPAWIYPIIKRGRVALALAFGSPSPPNPADSIAYRRLTRPERRLTWIRRAVDLADDALRRDPESAEALALRGDARYALVAAGVPNGDSLARLAEGDLRAALERRSDLVSAWATLAQLARYDGRFADAAAAAKHAFETDAFFEAPRVVSIGFMTSLHAGEIADARHWCRLGLDHYPGDPRFTECQLRLLGWTGRSPRDVTAAWQLLRQIEQRDTLRVLTPTWVDRRLMVAAVVARAGMPDSSRNILATIDAARKSDSSKRASPLTEAYVRLLLGERARALALLAEHVRATPQGRAQLARHPWFRTLHGNADFLALVQPKQ